MNASCALQHFCDIHGPQILLCTDTRSYIQDVDDDDEDLKTFFSQYVKSESTQGKTECKSCTLSSESILVSTVDSANHMVYISSPSTPNQELFKTVRNACVRSLNIEKAADVDSPILFGDDENGYCLSLAFSCKDFIARGSQRLYSLCYLSRDKYHLVSLLNFLTKSLRQIAHWLQSDANETYEQEGRIKINTNLNGIATSTTVTYIFRTPPNTPSQRMLCDVVHDPKIIYRVHALFVWLLRTANLAINESLFDALPTEEDTTRQERKDIFDSEEIVVRRRAATIVARSQQESLVMSATLTETQNQSYLASSIYSTAENYYSNENDLQEDEDFDSQQYQFSSYGHEALKLFQLFIKKLNNTKHLQYILQHWTIGNRLLIKYTNRIHNKNLIPELVSVFRLFLPDGCFQLIEATNQITTYSANMILLNTDMVLKNEWLSSLIDNPSEYNTIIIKIILDDIDDCLRVVKLETLPPTKSEVPVPMYVKTLVELLTDIQLDEEIFQSIINQNKIKYLNKAKLYFQFGRCQIAATSALNNRQQIKIFNLENVTDLELIRFWQKGLSQAYRKQIRLLKQDFNHQQTKK